MLVSPILHSPVFFSDSSCPVLCCCICQIEPYSFLSSSCFSLISRSNCSCFCYSNVSWQVFSTYSFVSSYERCTVGQSNSFWESTTTKKYFLSHRRLLLCLPPKNFFNKGFATSPRNGAAADAISPKGIPLPLCFLYRLFLSPIYQTPFLTDCFPLIVTNHHLFNWLHMFYVLG